MSDFTKKCIFGVFLDEKINFLVQKSKFAFLLIFSNFPIFDSSTSFNEKVPKQVPKSTNKTQKYQFYGLKYMKKYPKDTNFDDNSKRRKKKRSKKKFKIFDFFKNKKKSILDKFDCFFVRRGKYEFSIVEIQTFSWKSL